MMNYWLRTAPLRPFAHAIFFGATSNKVAFEAKPLPRVVRFKAQCKKGYNNDFCIRATVYSACCHSAATLGFQRRLLSIEKERRWSVAAAAVSVSKRREHKQIAPKLSGKFAGEAQATNTESPVVDGIEMEQRIADTAPQMVANSGMELGTASSARLTPMMS